MSIIKTLVIAVIAGTAMLASAIPPAPAATVAVQSQGGLNCAWYYIKIFGRGDWYYLCTESPEEDESEVPPGG